MQHLLPPLALCIMLVACGDGPPVAPRPVEAEPAAAVPPGQAREVFRLVSDGTGGIRVTGTVSTADARDALLDEIGRRWPAATVRAEVTVDPRAPALWVPEAVAMMPFAAQAQDGGLVVLAEAGQAGGGTLAISGRVADEETRDRLMADAAGTVAPPFVVRGDLEVRASDEVVADAGEAEPAVVAGSDEAGPAAAALRSALTGMAIAFEPGSAEFAPGAGVALDAVASVLASHPEVRILVATSGGSSGSGALDRALSVRRAEAIVRGLMDRGADGARASVAPPGEGPASVLFTLTVGA